MAKRAAICIGVNRPKGMTTLTAAAQDAVDFEAWAVTQGCETTLLTDDPPRSRVVLSDVFDAVEPIVQKGTYDQLIIYFSGHGILLAPGAEYWLLSGGPNNPNEAVNLLRSVEDARNSAIPHVVFVSDACRSAANTTILRAVTGGLIFPPQPAPPKRSEIDVYYATLPGDPANEVPQATATQAHRGLFTDCLLDVVRHPPGAMIESTVEAGATITVLSSRQLKDYLEARVPVAAAAVNLALNQSPEVRVETVLPKYFARVDRTQAAAIPAGGPPPASPPAVGSASGALRTLAIRSGMAAEVQRLADTRGRGHFETRTGFSVHGAGVAAATSIRWTVDPPFPEPTGAGAGAAMALHVRLKEIDQFSTRASSILFEFDSGTGIVLPVLPGFIGTIVVDRGRVIAVNFVPSDQTWRYGEYQQRAKQLDEMKAFAAVASRNGRFQVDAEDAAKFADRIRQSKGVDPTMGLYAVYAYAQVGRYEDVYSVFGYMRGDEIELPIPFDVAMLALRFNPALLTEANVRIAPFAPMLSQGWALLMKGDAMHRPVHEELRPHLLPSLFATLDAEGVAIARAKILTGENK